MTQINFIRALIDAGTTSPASVTMSGNSDRARIFITVSQATSSLEMTESVLPNATTGDWSVTFVRDEDFLDGEINCDDVLEVNIEYRDSNNTLVVEDNFPQSIETTCQFQDPCLTQIDSVDGTTAVGVSGLQQLFISGTIINCAAVTVTVTHSASGLTLSQANVPVTNGQWQTTFVQGRNNNTNLKSFHCGEQILVSVTCDDNQSCSAESETIIACPTDCTGEVVRVQVTRLADNQRVVNPATGDLACAPEGKYRLEVIDPPSSDIIQYAWFKDDVDQNQNSRQITVSLTSHENVSYRVEVVKRNGCRVSRTITFSCSLPPPGECATEPVSLAVFDISGRNVTSEACLPAGAYQIRILTPSIPGLSFSWALQGQLPDPNQTGPTFNITLNAGEEKVIAVSVSQTGCPDIPGSITLTHCEIKTTCPEIEDIQIQQGDCSGNNREVTITTGLNGESGTTMSGDLVIVDSDGNERSLMARDGSATLGFSVTESLPVGETFTIELRVTQPKGCGSNAREFTVKPCTDTVIDPCFVFRILFLLGLGFLFLGMVFILCPQFVHPAIIELAPIIGLVMAGLGALLFIVFFLIWIFVCKPDFCDFLLIAWQIVFLAGLVFTYASFCPGCLYLGWGFILILAGFGIFIWWVLDCKPPLCTMYTELFLFVLLVADVVSVVEIVLGSCVLTSDPIMALVWLGFLIGLKLLALGGLSRNRCVIRF